MLFVSCNYCTAYKYAAEVKKESSRNLQLKKNFFLKLAFEGVVQNKNICSECDNYNKYQIYFDLKTRNIDTITLFYSQYQPFYNFKNKGKFLELSVEQKIFNYLNVGDSITKDSASPFLISKNTSLRILNDEPSKWIPQ